MLKLQCFPESNCRNKGDGSTFYGVHTPHVPVNMKKTTILFMNTIFAGLW